MVRDMRTGKIVKPDEVQDHISDLYIEVFPKGTMRELRQIRAVPLTERTYSKEHFKTGGQSPILVRKSYYDRHMAHLT